MLLVDKQGVYGRQMQLLVQSLPVIFREQCFALKGGTAINLFIRDLPRLSVDIDLVYLPRADRNSALAAIRQALSRIAEDLIRVIPSLVVHKSFEDKPDALRLVIGQGDVHIKIELSPVLRECVFEPERHEICARVEEEFGYVEAPLVSFADLYGGKICAALDRQHPRDLFDVKILMEHEGITETVRKAVLVYMISHPRPIAELVAPHLLDIAPIYENEFTGMTADHISLEALLDARERLIKQLTDEITDDEKQFLISFKLGDPDWVRLGLPGIDQLPAVRWKLLNLDKLNKVRRQAAVDKLRQALGMS